MAGKPGKKRKSEISSAETQTNISINAPSIPFDKPKKSKEKSDNEGLVLLSQMLPCLAILYVGYRS